MEVAFLIIFTFCVVLLTIWLTRNSNGKKSLPGPMGLPVVGYLPFMTKKPYVKLTELAETYGPVYSLPLGSKRILVLTDFRSIKEAFGKEAFAGHPPDLPFELGEESLRTKAFLGRPWKEQSRFCLKTLRNVGFGKSLMEDQLKEEIMELMVRMSQHVGTTIRMSEFLSSSMSNNIASLLFGIRMRHDDPKRIRIVTLFSEVGKYGGALSWQFYFPWIRALMKRFSMGNQGKLMKAVEGTKTYCREEINKHENTVDPNNVRDFVDGYLLEIRKRSNIQDTTFKKEVLVDLSRLFFGAGGAQPWITVEWALLFCAALPRVQSRIRKEIDKVLGQNRFPTGQDRFDMLYTEAVLCETLRWVTTLPLNIMH